MIECVCITSDAFLKVLPKTVIKNHKNHLSLVCALTATFPHFLGSLQAPALGNGEHFMAYLHIPRRELPMTSGGFNLS